MRERDTGGKPANKNVSNSSWEKMLEERERAARRGDKGMREERPAEKK